MFNKTKLIATLLVVCFSTTACLNNTQAQSSNNLSLPPEKITPSQPEEQPEIYSLMTFLDQNLSLDHYAGFSKTDSNVLTIWYIEKSEVEAVVNRFGTHDVEVIYEQAKYPASQLLPIYTAVTDSEVMFENMQLVDCIGIKGNGVEIAVLGDKNYMVLVDWLNNYEWSEYCYIFDISKNTHIYPQEPQEVDNCEVIEQWPGYYIRDNLPHNIYSDYTREGEVYNGIIHDVFTVYCTNIAEVKEFLDSKKFITTTPYIIQYKQTDYSKEYLEPYLNEITSSLEEIQNNLKLGDNDPLRNVKIREGRIEIEVWKDIDCQPYVQWVEVYEQKDLITFHEVSQAPNPS